MNNDKIKNLLEEADQAAGPPRPVSPPLAAIIRRRARQKHFKRIAAPVAAAAVLVIGLGIWSLSSTTLQIPPDQQRITSLEDQLRQLQARTDATLNLIHEVLEREREQRRLDVLEARLAGLRHPLEKMQDQIDQTAFIIVYQANNKYRHLNLMDSAIEDYKRVIELFPKNRWAEVARTRLSEIQNDPANKNAPKIKKGDLL